MHEAVTTLTRPLFLPREMPPLRSGILGDRFSVGSPVLTARLLGIAGTCLDGRVKATDGSPCIRHAGSETRYQGKKSIVVWSGIRDPSQIVLAEATRSAYQHHDLSMVSEFQSWS